MASELEKAKKAVKRAEERYAQVKKITANAQLLDSFDFGASCFKEKSKQDVIGYFVLDINHFNPTEIILSSDVAAVLNIAGCLEYTENANVYDVVGYISKIPMSVDPWATKSYCCVITEDGSYKLLVENLPNADEVVESCEKE